MPRLLFPLLLFFSLCFLSSPSVVAQSLPKAIQQYTAAWQESADDRRMEIIQSFWTEESIYEDPGVYAKGSAALKKEIDKFWKDFPGATLEMGIVLSKGNFHTWEWKIRDNKNNLVVSGVDYAETNEKNQLLRLTGFWYPQQHNRAQSNASLVETYYESLFKKQDFATIQKIIAVDALYYQATGLPYGGTYKGFAEWVTMYTKAAAYFDLRIEKEPQYFTNELKTEVVIQFTIQCTSKKTGQKISMPISEQFELRDNKIVSIRPFYFDTKEFVAFIEAAG